MKYKLKMCVCVSVCLHKGMLATYMPSMRNSNLKIEIAGSSGCPQLHCEYSRFFLKYDTKHASDEARQESGHFFLSLARFVQWTKEDDGIIVVYFKEVAVE